MSTTTSPAADAAKPAKAGGGLAKALFVVVAFVAGAAAGGFGAVIGAGKLGLGGEAGHATDKAAVAAKAPVEYVEIDNAFTSNLVDTGRYLQVRLSVSTTGGGDVVAAIGKHKPALISAILSVLGELAEIDVADRPAKDKLRGKLKAAINDSLRAKGEAIGIDEVFFTSMVVQ
jgi:flagellar basal body-associated protein FliL